MIEYLMLITLGACGASLIWLGLWPALTRRTERLVRRRIEATLPMSISEFANERDQLRAAIAVKEARIAKQAEELAERHAEMVAEMGRANARLALLEESHATGAKREGELTAEHEELKAVLAGRDEALENERQAHQTARSELAALDLAHRTLVTGHESLAEAAEVRRVEAAALQAEREALLGRIESLEAAHKALHSEHSALLANADDRSARNAALGAERDMYLEDKATLEEKLHALEARLAELGEHLSAGESERTRAEVRAADFATRLSASDAHGARLALDLKSAVERLTSLGSLHEAAQGQATVATTELAALRHKIDAERERAENAEAAERLHVANAVAELHKLEEELERERAKLATATASLQHVRLERDRLRAELAKLAPRPGEAAAEQSVSESTAGRDDKARGDLVAMIERLADDIAQATGAEALPPVAATRAPDIAQPAAAAE